MKNIEGKIFIDEKQDSAVISIPAQIPKWQETLLLAWVLGWTLCGLVVFIEMFGDYSRNMQLMMFVYMAFWVYFEYKAVHAFLWKKWGTEFIKIDEEGMQYKRDIKTYGIAKTYFKENIKDLKAINMKDRSFVKAYFDTFWTIGNEKIQFKYLGKTVLFGMGLSDTQRDELLSQLKYQFKKRF